MHGIGIVLLGAVLFGIYTFYVHKTLTRLQQECKEAWRETEFYLKHRYDIVALFISLLQNKMPQATNVIEKLTTIRHNAMTCLGEMKQMSRVEGDLATILIQTLSFTNNNPLFQQDAAFIKLQQNLKAVNDKIEAAGRFYNGNVWAYNAKVGQFPSNIVAAMFHFEPKALFEPKVDTEQIDSASL